MNENDLSISELRQKRGGTLQTEERPDGAGRGRSEREWGGPYRPWPQAGGSRTSPGHVEISGEEPPTQLPFDPVRLFDALKRRWAWWVGAGLIVFACGTLWTFLSTRSSVTAQLMRRDVPVLFRASETGDAFRPQSFSQQTLVNLMVSPEVIGRVAAKSDPPIAGDRLARSITILPERDSDLVTISLIGDRAPEDAVNLLNLYAEETVNFTREIQTREAAEFSAYLTERLSVVEAELQQVNALVSRMPSESRFLDPDKQTEALLVQLSDLDVQFETSRIEMETHDFRIKALQREMALRNPATERLQAARDDLTLLLARYTDAHPNVQEARARIAALEKEVERISENPGAVQFIGSPATDTIYMNILTLQSERQSLSRQVEQVGELRERLATRLESLGEGSLEYALLKSRHASLELLRTMLSSRLREAELFMENSLGYYTVFTPASLDRVSMRSHWKKQFILSVAAAAFIALMIAGMILFVEILDDRLKTAADIERATDLPVLATLGDLDRMSAKARAAWAFRTWTIIKGKLGESQSTGSVCGFISARHGEGRSTWVRMLIQTANERGLRVLTVATRHADEGAMHPHEKTDDQSNVVSTTLSPNVFSFPAQVAQKLNEPDSHSVVHIPLPGWVWNLERRQQWQVALNHWRRIDNLVLLVELPPVTEPEAILLAEKIPQVIWLAESGRNTFKETRMHLETLRHAGCNLVGSVLNREPASFWRSQFSRWFRSVALFLSLSAFSIFAQEPASDPAATAAEGQAPQKLWFSASDPSQRAQWQKRLTLGPGDVLNINFFGQINLAKAGLVVGPDGYINYLQLSDVRAAGLTVDELRETLDRGLSEFYRAPRTMVTPVTFNSKRYYVLGKVMMRGVFPLDRPMTVVEALAQAQGVETGLLHRNSVDLADLQRSFLIRGGERIPVDFERLFQQGDLSQNILIEPDDYIYFPPTNLREVYVVGEVLRPGILAYTANATLIAALSDRGGFTDRAFKRRVLVIRGSINSPETFILNAMDILQGREPDFKLEARDIVYVSHRPFIRVEELLDTATSAFIQSAVTAWAGAYIGPIIKSPILPGL